MAKGGYNYDFLIPVLYIGFGTIVIGTLAMICVPLHYLYLLT
jgi:hypothetical protein